LRKWVIQPDTHSIIRCEYLKVRVPHGDDPKSAMFGRYLSACSGFLAVGDGCPKLEGLFKSSLAETEVRFRRLDCVIYTSSIPFIFGQDPVQFSTYLSATTFKINICDVLQIAQIDCNQVRCPSQSDVSASRGLLKHMSL
jgi:hypothetical protein